MANVIGQPTDTVGPATRAAQAGLRAAEPFDQVRADPGYAPATAQMIATVAGAARRVRGVSELVLVQSRLGFVVDSREVRDALQSECSMLAEVLRADAAAIGGEAVPVSVPDLPASLRASCCRALRSWGGAEPGALAALGAILGWEWLRLVHQTLVRVEPEVVAMADVAGFPWWR